MRYVSAPHIAIAPHESHSKFSASGSVHSLAVALHSRHTPLPSSSIAISMTSSIHNCSSSMSTCQPPSKDLVHGSWCMHYMSMVLYCSLFFGSGLKEDYPRAASVPGCGARAPGRLVVWLCGPSCNKERASQGGEGTPPPSPAGPGRGFSI